MNNFTTKYQSYNLKNFTKIPAVEKYFSKADIDAVRVVGSVLPFKVNNYVTEQLIDWDNIPEDPMFQLTFPQKEMLTETDFRLMENAINNNVDKAEQILLANKIRFSLNPHPDGQKNNIPRLNRKKLQGIQHKYNETVLFFPSNSQTCHAYCTFCFRWPQFTGISNLKFSMKEVGLLVDYLETHGEVTDLLFTGGDPMIMSAEKLSQYIEPVINSKKHNVSTIRIGTKSLGYWPYRYLSDKDSDDILRLFEKVVKKGFHLAFMAHVNHPRELETKAVQKAIKRILNTGALIRTQSPVMKHINNNPGVWQTMWKQQVKLGMIPYYMFMARDTGAQDYFAVTLNDAWEIFTEAYKNVSGIARTVKGPVMSADPGKVHILGVNKINGEKVFSLRFVQARETKHVNTPFFARYNHDAIWLDDLKPWKSNKFFFE